MRTKERKKEETTTKKIAIIFKTELGVGGMCGGYHSNNTIKFKPKSKHQT